MSDFKLTHKHATKLATHHRNNISLVT